MNGGVCVEGDGTFICRCMPGFKGKTCDSKFVSQVKSETN